MVCLRVIINFKSSMRRLLLTLVVVVLAQAQTPPDLHGIYIYTNDVSQVSTATAKLVTQSFSLPGVDGVAVQIGWQAVEPALGQYDWSLLDQWLAKAIATGKKIDLVIPAGSATPAWLFQPPPAGAGATELSFTVSPHAGATGVCDADNIAAPWDPVFLTQWDAMLSALSTHLKAANEYTSITLLRLTGINRTSEELRLPAETAASTGLACVSNSLAIWQQAGYKPSLLLQGWNAVVNSFNKYFPDKSFAVSIIANNAFPGINENGTLIKGAIGDENEPLLQSASLMLPGRLVVQVDFLMPGEPASVLVTNAAQNYGTLAAFQTNEYLGGNGAACSEPVTNPTPCTAATFIQLLDTGIYPLGQSNSLRSQYIEVFHDNAAAFPDDILTAHLQLVLPSFFTGEVPVGSGAYYLQFPDGNPFGYYNFPSSAILYHYDMGFEAFVPGASSDIYLYDFTSSHWWYTSTALFPYLYDFTLNSWLYYFPDTKNPGHYASNPRSFSNLTAGKIVTM
jgi:hypothetical protein